MNIKKVPYLPYTALPKKDIPGIDNKKLMQKPSLFGSQK